MSWYRDDTFEFTTPTFPSCSISASPGGSYYPLSCSPCSFDFVNPTLERDFCSNFTCCGLRLADLHELLAHLEISHGSFQAPAVDDDFAPISPMYTISPTSSSPPSTPESSELYVRAPDLLSSSSSSSSPSSGSSSPEPLTDVDTPEVMSDLEAFVDTESSQPCSDSTAIDRNGATPSLIFLPPSSFSVPIVPSTSQVKKSSDPRQRTSRPRSRLTPLIVTSSSSSSSSSVVIQHYSKSRHIINSHSRSHGRGQGQSHARKREKTFKCPRSGCTKAYLNPNGLKYHVEKGTCKIDTDLDVLGTD
jgi:hypothetical protein